MCVRDYLYPRIEGLNNKKPLAEAMGAPIDRLGSGGFVYSLYMTTSQASLKRKAFNSSISTSVSEL